MRIVSRAVPLLSLLALVAVAGCRVPLSPAGVGVRVTANPDAVKGCQSLGLVKGSDHMNGGIVGQGAAADNATTRLRNETAKMGGNVVFMLSKNTGKNGAEAEGEAYKCGGEVAK